MILGDVVHSMPSQLPIIEWGTGSAGVGGGTIPGANDTFTSGWFDTWRTSIEDVIEPISGLVVSTGDESVFGAGTHRKAGVYYLHLYIHHNNVGAFPLRLEVQQVPTPAMINAFLAFQPGQIFVVPTSNSQVNQPAGLDRRVVIRQRMVRLDFTYPAAVANLWQFSAILRSS